jgi:transcriptional regulator with XRE-family HTH domain
MDPMPYSKNLLAERLLHLRKKHNLSQSAASEAIRCSQTTWSAWEAEKTEPSASHLVAIAKTFDVTVDYLVGLSDNPTLYPSGHWMVDLDIVERLRGDEPQPQLRMDGSEGWAAAIPDKVGVVTSAEYARLSREMAQRMATLHKRKPKRR